MNNDEIHHQSEESLFFIRLNDGQRAFVKYRLSGLQSGEARVDFYSTFVPDNHRGKGLAGKLVEHAFAWADAEQLHIDSSCWYASKKLEQRQR